MRPSQWGPAECREAYEHGASVRDISIVTGKAPSTIHKRLVKADTKFREPHKHHREVR